MSECSFERNARVILKKINYFLEANFKYSNPVSVEKTKTQQHVQNCTDPSFYTVHMMHLSHIYTFTRSVRNPGLRDNENCILLGFESFFF